MNQSLRELKQNLRAKYLGHAGIHGLSVRKAGDALYVHLKRDESQEQANLLKKLEAEAAPLPLVVLDDEAPRLQVKLSGT